MWDPKALPGPCLPQAEARAAPKKAVERETEHRYLPLLGDQPEDLGNSFARKRTYKKRNWLERTLHPRVHGPRPVKPIAVQQIAEEPHSDVPRESHNGHWESCCTILDKAFASLGPGFASRSWAPTPECGGDSLGTEDVALQATGRGQAPVGRMQH